MYLLSSDFRAIASSFCWLDYSTLLFNCPYCRKFLFKLPSLVLTIGACDDGPSLLRLFVALPSLRLSCSLASWYVTSMAISSLLIISKMCCTTASSSTNQITPALVAFGFYLFFGIFPRLPCLPMWCGQNRVMDIFSRPTRPIKDKQFLEPPSKVTRPEVPQVMF